MHIPATLNIREATTRQDIQRCYSVMRHLRPHFMEEKAFVEQVERQYSQGYRLIYLEEEGEIKAVSGFRLLEFLGWGKTLCIDDLVTDPKARKQGYASALLNWFAERARQEKCQEIHLDSAHHRHEAHRLYLRHYFKMTAHHFVREL